MMIIEFYLTGGKGLVGLSAKLTSEGTLASVTLMITDIHERFVPAFKNPRGWPAGPTHSSSRFVNKGRKQIEDFLRLVASKEQIKAIFFTADVPVVSKR